MLNCSMVHAATNTRLKQAFSLIELAVLLAIFGGIASMSLVVGKEWMAKEQIKATQRNMATIEMALQTYVNAYGRLPCPADLTHTPATTGYGLEAYESGETDGVCTGGASINAASAIAGVSYGSVPAKTLGLPDAVMRDQWGNLFVYYVTNTATRKGSFLSKPTAHANYIALNAATGSITINDVNGTAITTSAIYALVSHGKNSHGGYAPVGTRKVFSAASADELQNCNCNASAAAGTINATLVARLPNTTFDDFVTFALRRNLGN